MNIRRFASYNMETLTLDASKEPLGRVASKAAVVLMGKHLPSFEKYRKIASHVVVTNADRLVLTGRKETQKRYYRHSGRIGNLKEFTAGWMREHDSRELGRLAVLGMFPKNKLRSEMIKNL